MSEAEFREAFHKHKEVVYRFAYRMTGSEQAAEDVVQECFLALWGKSGAYDRERGELRAFLLGVARHIIFRQWRTARPSEALDEEAFSCGPFDAVGQERSETIAQAVQMLPPLQREAVILAEYEEMSLAEIARTTGAELTAVKSRLHRARVNLRRMLAPLLHVDALERKGVSYGTKR